MFFPQESDRLTLTRTSSSSSAHNTNSKIAEKTSTLTISVGNALPSDAGHYACAASNYLGADVRSQRLDVLGPPSVRPMGQRAAVAGRDFQVNCPYGGHPLGEIKWSKEGE
jgi:argininosuccinate lyase